MLIRLLIPDCLSESPKKRKYIPVILWPQIKKKKAPSPKGYDLSLLGISINPVADSLIKGSKLCIPLIYSSVLLHTLWPARASKSQNHAYICSTSTEPSTSSSSRVIRSRLTCYHAPTAGSLDQYVRQYDYPISRKPTIAQHLFLAHWVPECWKFMEGLNDTHIFLKNENLHFII